MVESTSKPDESIILFMWLLSKADVESELVVQVDSWLTMRSEADDVSPPPPLK